MPSNSRRASDAERIRQEDADRSFELWKKLDTMSLRLKCNTYNLISTGKKENLAVRLFEYFQERDVTPPPQESPSPSDEELPVHPDDILEVNAPDDVEELIYSDEDGNSENDFDFSSKQRNLIL